MFTGIIEEIGSLRSLSTGADSCVMRIIAANVLDGTKLGDSIAVNGVCLTVIDMWKGGFSADVMPETLRRSNLGQLRSGDIVNLERATAVGDRLGGHIVSGHIDGVGRITNVNREGNAIWLSVAASSEILNLVVEKGSIAIDGVSLTVADVDESVFCVSIIPHTGSETNLLNKREGDVVNIENDIIGKYVDKLMRNKKAYTHQKRGGRVADGEGKAKDDVLTLEYLEQNGF